MTGVEGVGDEGEQNPLFVEAEPFVPAPPSPVAAAPPGGLVQLFPAGGAADGGGAG